MSHGPYFEHQEPCPPCGCYYPDTLVKERVMLYNCLVRVTHVCVHCGTVDTYEPISEMGNKVRDVLNHFGNDQILHSKDIEEKRQAEYTRIAKRDTDMRSRVITTQQWMQIMRARRRFIRF
jgi:hypothetical protein